MKVRLKSRVLILTGETPEEVSELTAWSANQDGHVYYLKCQDEQTVRLTSLGPREDACREPINVTSRSNDPRVQLISNLAPTPFEYDGLRFGSIEAFWQGLKFPDEARRLAIAPLAGHEARRAGIDAAAATTFIYQGREIRVGTADHWELMARACWLKFNQDATAREALLSTKQRPLEHRTRRDSRNIPGVVMADIWMKVRLGLQRRAANFASIADDDAAANQGQVGGQ